MAATVLRHISAADKYLLTATTFWSLISTTAGAVSSFYSTQQYTNNINNSGKYIFSAIAFTAFHLIIFFSNPNTLKHTFAPFFPGSAMKWMLRFTATRFGYLIHHVSERSEIGLIFVICVWIDAIAIGRIIRPANDLWIVNSVFMAVVSRSLDLYGFSGGYWLVMLLCFPLILLQVRLEGYESDETKEKEG